MRSLDPLPLAAGPRVVDALPRLRHVIAGSMAALPVPADDHREATRLTTALRAGESIDDATSLVIATSGTTGIPKGAMHSDASLAASASATDARLGGPGAWLLALPPHHIAGLQVLLRCLRADFDPVVIDVAHGFDPAALADAIATMDGPRRYTSLVPTQLLKVLDHPRATAALREVDAVLIGGAATPETLQRRAFDAGLPIVRTYGMSETCGGCVYDGVPLDGVTVRLDEASEGVGRVVLGGPVVASGYRDMPEHPAFAVSGEYRTDDLGRFDNGVLSIVGRADEAITTGGLTVVPQVVEAAVLRHPSVLECAVLGVPDDRLGEKVVAVIVTDASTTVTEQSVRALVADQLDGHAVPRSVVVMDALPTRGPGKVDRRTLRALLTHM